MDNHLAKLKLVLTRLRDANLKINSRRSFFCAVETEHLGYILTREGIKPQPKKAQSILAPNPPKSVKELGRLLDIVQYYRDLWAQRSEMLAPVTSMVGECGHTITSKPRWHWDAVHQKAFNDVRATIVKDVALAYPVFPGL